MKNIIAMSAMISLRAFARPAQFEEILRAALETTRLGGCD